MDPYRLVLDYLTAAMELLDDIGDTQIAAELSMPIYTLAKRLGDKASEADREMDDSS